MILSNEYFDSNVKSLGYKTKEGDSTVGVMEEGQYEFGTSKHEIMTVIEGELLIQFPNTTEWVSYTNGKTFEVEANKTFGVKAIGQTSYLCLYR